MTNNYNNSTGYNSGGNSAATIDTTSTNSAYARDESPGISLPKGGGGIRRIDENFSVNAATSSTAA